MSDWWCPIFHSRYTKFVGDLIYKPPIGLGSHGTKVFK